MPDFILGDVPKTSAVSRGGILEIRVNVRPFVNATTQTFAKIISKTAISTSVKNDFNMSKTLFNNLV